MGHGSNTNLPYLSDFDPKSEMGIGYLPQPAGQLIVRSPKAMHF
jgi:hypothetical protein